MPNSSLREKNSYRKVSAEQHAAPRAVKSEIYFYAANGFHPTCVQLLLVKLIIENRLNKLTAVKILCWYYLYSSINIGTKFVVLYAMSPFLKRIFEKNIFRELVFLIGKKSQWDLPSLYNYKFWHAERKILKRICDLQWIRNTNSSMLSK